MEDFKLSNGALTRSLIAGLIGFAVAWGWTQATLQGVVVKLDKLEEKLDNRYVTRSEMLQIQSELERRIMLLEGVHGLRVQPSK